MPICMIVWPHPNKPLPQLKVNVVACAQCALSDTDFIPSHFPLGMLVITSIIASAITPPISYALGCAKQFTVKVWLLKIPYNHQHLPWSPYSYQLITLISSHAIRCNDYRSYDLLIKQTMRSQHPSAHLVIQPD